jgi:rubredoxin
MSQPTDLRDVFNLGCPACGQANELVIMITTLSRVTPEGSEPEGDHEWDEASYCRCPECGHDGNVADFTQTISDAEKAALSKLNGGAQ